MPKVVEWPDVVRDPGRLQRGPELFREDVLAVDRAALGMAEDELVLTPEARAASVLPERLSQRVERAIARMPSSVFESRTRSTLATRSTSPQRSAWSSPRLIPVRTSVRKIVRAGSSVNALSTRETSTGSRIRHRRRPSFGCSAASTGFDSISSSRFAVLKTSWRSDRSRLTVDGS